MFNFTKAAIEALPLTKEKGKHKIYYDTKEKKLYISVGTQFKTFYVLKKQNGEVLRVKIGRFPDIAVERARKICLFLKSQLEEGKTLDEIRNKHKKEETFGNIFETYINDPEKQKTPYWKEQRSIFERYAFPLFKKQFSSVSRKEINNLFKEVSKHSKSQANKLLVTINRMYKKKIEDEELDILNPAYGIKKNPKEVRDRFLQAEELPLFFKALDTIKSDYFADYVKISLWTGARRSNVLGMKWTSIDFINKFWKISANESKNKDTMVLPLNDRVIEILKRRKKNNHSIYVFPNPNNPEKHIVEIKRLWKVLLQKAGITDLRPHDMRRSYASYMAISGANLPNIAKALGHKSLQSTEIYARLNMKAVEETSNKGIERMVQCIGGC